MKVLYYTNKDVKDRFVIPSIIESTGDIATITFSKPTLDFILSDSIEFIVCDRARSLLTPDILSHLKNRAVNIHPSFLPWNKGYHPNYWSFRNGTPKGVTIHYIDETIDTGHIIAQTRVSYLPTDTLKTSYERLRRLSIALFSTLWPMIRTGQTLGIPQPDSMEGARTHYKAESEVELMGLSAGWDTDVGALTNGRKETW